jgi:hypothetical protein
LLFRTTRCLASKRLPRSTLPTTYKRSTVRSCVVERSRGAATSLRAPPQRRLALPRTCALVPRTCDEPATPLLPDTLVSSPPLKRGSPAASASKLFHTARITAFTSTLSTSSSSFVLRSFILVRAIVTPVRCSGAKTKAKDSSPATPPQTLATESWRTHAQPQARRRMCCWCMPRAPGGFGAARWMLQLRAPGGFLLSLVIQL